MTETPKWKAELENKKVGELIKFLLNEQTRMKKMQLEKEDLKMISKLPTNVSYNAKVMMLHNNEFAFRDKEIQNGAKISLFNRNSDVLRASQKLGKACKAVRQTHIESTAEHEKQTEREEKLRK